MADTLIASGGANDFSRIKGLDSHFREGEQGHLAIYTRTGLPGAVVSGIEGTCKLGGVNFTQKVYQSGGALHFHFKKGIAPLVIIAAAVAAAIIIIVLVVAWKLMKLSPMAVAGISLLYLGIILAVVVIAAKMFKSTS